MTKSQVNKVKLESIQEAYEKRIKPYINETNLIYADKISQLTGNNVYLKLENLQKTGSFKIRGALNKIQQLSPAERKQGIVAASAGNHAQGVALAASLLNIKSTIIMPKTAPISKIEATRAYGAKVILREGFFDDCLNYAKQLVKEENLVLIHAYDDPDVIIGQGTIGLEIAQQLKHIDYCLVPVGGGGIMSGIATSLTALLPDTKMIAVEAENFNSLQQAFANKKPKTIAGKTSLADGIAVKRIGDITYQILEKHVSDVITVSEAEIADAMLFLLEKCKIITEGSGAVGVAALLNNKLGLQNANKTIVAIISGGNVDVTAVHNIINKGLFAQNRRVNFTINAKLGDNTISNVSQIIADNNAVIYKIESTKNRLQLETQQIQIEFVINTTGKEHSDLVIDKLKAADFEPLAIN